MKDEVDTLVHDVKLYSEGLVNALQNNHPEEAFDYVQDMQRCLKIVEEYLEMKKKIK